MTGYLDDPRRNEAATSSDYYRTGDIASQDSDGYITYIGRTDDVFESSDYEVSPFELESMLIEHPAVVEAAVVPQPDDTRLAVPKAYVAIADGWQANAEAAKQIMDARAITSRLISGFGVSVYELPRRSQARFARSIFAAGRMPLAQKALKSRPSTGTRICCRSRPGGSSA